MKSTFYACSVAQLCPTFYIWRMVYINVEDACYIWKLIEEILRIFITRKNVSVSIWDNGCSVSLLWYSFHDIHFIMLYTLNLYSAVCQLIAQWNWKERKKEGRRERKRERERKKGGRKEGREGAREGGSHQKKKKSNRDISGMYMASDLFTWVLWIHYLPHGW